MWGERERKRKREIKMVNDRRNLGATLMSQMEEKVRKQKNTPRERFSDIITSFKKLKTPREWECSFPRVSC